MVVVGDRAAVVVVVVVRRHLQAQADALLRGHVTGVGARVGEPLAAVGAGERLLARVDAHVLLQVVLKLERLITVGTFKLAQQRRLVVGDHVALQPVHVGELLVAHLAALERGK